MLLKERLDFPRISSVDCFFPNSLTRSIAMQVQIPHKIKISQFLYNLLRKAKDIENFVPSI